MTFEQTPTNLSAEEMHIEMLKMIRKHGERVFKIYEHLNTPESTTATFSASREYMHATEMLEKLGVSFRPEPKANRSSDTPAP